MALKSWNNLISSILRLPGVGPKMAERLALYLLRHGEEAKELVERIEKAQTQLANCPLCGDFMEPEDPGLPPDPCERCRDERRDSHILCVVEEIGDLQALERSRAFQGQYHVLGGVLSALDGIGPEELRIEALLKRIESQNVREVIIATNPTAEGETTATYLADLLGPSKVNVTRLAYGLPSGSAIQYADELTLSRAIEGRKNLQV